ncbi:MAG TPA: hypothetical protein VHW95_08280, partial [Steroidobacteraceae bacterium]|nr:hypothetical protein [Steroidobacteraceae bacterium]
GRGEGLLFVAEDEVITPLGERRYVDGALVEQSLRLRHGYWEAKDTNDDLDAEIAKKLRRGYPQDNIIFEDSETAVLIQNKREVLRCAVDDPDAIERLVAQFFKFQPEVIQEFRKAVEKFREDLPAVLGALRETIDKAEVENPKFRQAAIKFLKHAQETINPSVNGMRRALTQEFNHITIVDLKGDARTSGEGCAICENRNLTRCGSRFPCDYYAAMLVREERCLR